MDATPHGRNQFVRAPCKLAACVLACALASSGCAFDDMATAAPRFARPTVRAFARNSIVAAPTLVGNVIGSLPAAAVGVVFAAPAYLFSGLDSDTAINVFQSSWFAVDAVFGGLVGLPFLPFSYLGEKDPWELGSGMTTM